MSSGQFLKISGGIVPESLFLDKYNSLIFLIPAKDGGSPPERLFAERSKNWSLSMPPISGGSVETSCVACRSSRSSVRSLPRGAGMAPPSELLRSTRTRNAGSVPRAGGIPPVRALSDRSSEMSDVSREMPVGMAPARWLPLRLRLASAGNAARSRAASVPARPAPGSATPATRPSAPHVTPSHELHAAFVGDHEERAPAPVESGSGGGRVDFHRSSARASAAVGEAAAVPVDDVCASNCNASA